MYGSIVENGLTLQADFDLLDFLVHKPYTKTFSPPSLHGHAAPINCAMPHVAVPRAPGTDVCCKLKLSTPPCAHTAPPPAAAPCPSARCSAVLPSGAASAAPASAAKATPSPPTPGARAAASGIAAPAAAAGWLPEAPLLLPLYPGSGCGGSTRAAAMCAVRARAEGVRGTRCTTT